jgi:hypothetical protein
VIRPAGNRRPLIAFGRAAMNTTRSLAPVPALVSLVTVLAAAAFAPAQGPGYDGPFPSERGKAAVRDLVGTQWKDDKNLVGGGTWRIEDGKVTPYAFGPARGDMIELRCCEAKGPHLRLVRDHLAVCLPAATDGDVAATLRWLGRPVPEGLGGDTSEGWLKAVGRLAALGPEVGGVRLGLLADADPMRRKHAELVVWQVGAPAEPLVGSAELRIGRTTVPIRIVWPAKPDPGAGKSSLRLPAGSTHVQTFDVEELLAANGHAPLAGGTNVLRVVWTREPTDPPAAAASASPGPSGRAIVVETPPLELRVRGVPAVK